ncbi:DUF based on E. rectale Gene description [uncultured Blautia sp.]
MHSYLRAVGFSEIKKRREIEEIIKEVIETYDEKNVVEDYEDGIFAEFSKNYGCDCGITVCGQYDENNEFHVEYYFPFFRGTGITTDENVVVERHTAQQSFAGACDDLRIGVTLIFYLQNAAEYMLENQKGIAPEGRKTLTISGLAKEGMVLLPLQKDKEAARVERELAKNRSNLIAAARNGDEDAMESLTMEDMDTYSMISQRIVREDIFSIVDSYFMPYGIECDQYNVMGEILDFVQFKNILTGEEIYQLTLDSNDVQFDVCINKKDLLGEPQVGRRFKGIIWLQGQLHF